MKTATPGSQEDPLPDYCMGINGPTTDTSCIANIATLTIIYQHVEVTNRYSSFEIDNKLI